MTHRWAAIAARSSHAPALLLTAFLLASCATAPSDDAPTTPRAGQWIGRLAVVVATDPPGQFHAGFDLTGTADSGRLTLTSPLGSTLAVLRWAPGQALLRQGNEERNFGSIDALVAEATGTVLPVRALFAWLHGAPEPADGWQVDLSQLDDGRLIARRQAPPPATELRVVLDGD